MPIPADNQFSAPTTLTERFDIYPFIDPSKFTGSLTGKNVLVTGAGRGIGRATAHAFASAGANVVAVARRIDDINAVVSDIANKYPSVKAIAIQGDVAKEEDHQRIVQETKNKLGEIDVLINNAGKSRLGPFEYEQGLKGWWDTIQVNLFGVVGMTYAVLPSMLARTSGIIINVSSASVTLDLPSNVAYGASKAAVAKFTQGLHSELEGKGVTLYSVHPGTVQTDIATGEGDIFGVEKAMVEYPNVAQLFQEITSIKKQTPEVGANIMVALVALEDAKLLAGLYIDGQTDLGEMIAEAKKEGRGRIGKEDLYRLKIAEL